MIAHLRPIFLTFIALAFGLWIAKLSFYISSWILYSILILFGVLLLFVLLGLLFKKLKIFSVFFQIKWHIIVIFIPFCLGVGLFYLTYNIYSKTAFTPDKDTYYGIYGTISTNYIEKEKGIYFFLKDVQVVDVKENIDLDYNLFVYLYYPEGSDGYTEEELQKVLPGNRIFMHSKISKYAIFGSAEINSFAYSNHCQYSAFNYLSGLDVYDGGMGFWDAIREYIRGIYKTYMSDRYAGLSFSILVGDRTELADDIAYNFQISGIMHVVAVSGLNTAFIMTLLLWLLNKLRANKYIKLTVVIIVLLFYALLCNMTPSVVRASLMSVFLLIAHLFGKQQDNLNSISLSGIILLLLFPLYVFDLGFLLSYLGVFGIFLLYKPLSQSLAKLKCPKLTNALALTLSATIATTPIIINAFGYVSLIGLLANLVLVPLFGFAFMALFAITILALIIPYAGYLLYLIQYGFWVVDMGAKIFASVPYAAVKVKKIPEWSFVGYYGSIFMSSRFCVTKPKIKWTLAGSCFAIFCVGFILSIVL